MSQVSQRYVTCVTKLCHRCHNTSLELKTQGISEGETYRGSHGRVSKQSAAAYEIVRQQPFIRPAHTHTHTHTLVMNHGYVDFDYEYYGSRQTERGCIQSRQTAAIHSIRTHIRWLYRVLWHVRNRLIAASRAICVWIQHEYEN